MSNTKPTTRAELKEYIKLKLGSPVIQINLDDSQFDLAIDDAFQYFYERQHFDAIEKVYLSVQVQQPFIEWLKSGEVETVVQSDNQPRSAAGMVDTITLTTPGSGYPPTNGSNGMFIAETTGGTGTGLQLSITTARTTDNGLISATVYNSGTGYTAGDVITVVGGNNDCTFSVATVKTTSALYGTEEIKTQNNYIILPDGVIGVNRILSRGGVGSMGGGVIPGASFFNPFLAGGITGTGQMGNMNYGLSDYYSMQQYISTLQWNMYPPNGYSFNKRTHRLFLNTKNYHGQISVGDFLVFECDVEANADFYPDVFNDMFVKELAVAHTQITWGRVLTKYQQVQLPGGITLNGQEILQEGQQAAQALKDRFALDYADPVLDIVG